MHNILLILKHEYITRVSKKSFIIMTLLGPLLISAFYGVIIAISISQFSKDDVTKMAIYDPYNALKNETLVKKSYEFGFVKDANAAKDSIRTEAIFGMLIIQNSKGDSVELVTKKNISLNARQDLEKLIADKLFNLNLKANGMSKAKIDSLKIDIQLSDHSLSGKSNATEIKSVVGYVGAMVIYLFIFMYGVMIMRGVTEEKNNRIIEIIVSAVKPFQLMMGKILGVALVGLTQFLAWITLSGLLLFVLSIAIGAQHVDAAQMASVSKEMPSEIAQISDAFFQQFQTLNFPKLIIGFIIFFLGGFLLYSALFAAIGSAVDSDTETQQFMLPVSMPLIFGLVIAQVTVINDPNSTLAYWCSMVPFTSPVVMMVRLPFDISWMEIIISAVLLFGTFILVVWMAGKIYRIGILSYGQKASYKQMFKWLMTK